MKTMQLRTLLPLGMAGSMVAGYFASQSPFDSGEIDPRVADEENALPLPDWHLREELDIDRSIILVLEEMEREERQESDPLTRLRLSGSYR